ncbi:hypothetical protein A7E78_04025 [Syntrophotalea acetylenivorans]|uniref:Uncharacterized protein n=1 Tax=Syntrophotalea acetylenivorans TaxID=1842532 RepID=A0A1L3GMB6_9BACT|nr:hypothetical protein [Syntrophotalea acetylenivorans]APG27074.1 hypothetical protein A7E78_04025 [Syntrophotalea acetylenivorans]
MPTKKMLEELHQVCTGTLSVSLDEGNIAKMNKSCALGDDLTKWCSVLASKPELFLYRKAGEEYLTAMLNLAQGQYRNAFKCLRLVLELCIQGVYLSANIVELREWLNNISDTIWGKLVAPDTSPLGTRFCKAFFPEISTHAKNFQSMASTIYRELSETIHGNVPSNIPLPDSFEFDDEVFSLWHEKAETVRLVVAFCFCSRYLKELPPEDLSVIETIVVGQLDHIEQIRIVVGGPSSS